jgi:glycosyltransferase involved in cell wall biosynthesis
MPTGNSLRSLYICYLSLDDPLVETQVLAYLEGLARRGHHIHLLTFEPRLLAREECDELHDQLRSRGIEWHSLRYHKHPSLPATIYDALRGAALGVLLVRRHRLHAVHARSHVPAAAALVIRRLTRCRLIFDIRGLMGEEYVDARRWRATSLPFRLTKWVERRAIERADAIVVLTERVRRYLFGAQPRRDVWVIPCCADVGRLESQRDTRQAMREGLGLGDATVMVYVGKFTGWYMEREMVEFFASAREVIPNLHFLVLTQTDAKPILREFARVQARNGDYTVTGCDPRSLGKYLAACDMAIAFIRPVFSKISTSPTKIGEYLAAGLPTICSVGVGDVDGLIEGQAVGVLVDHPAPDLYEKAAQEADRLRQDPQLADRCRRAAREHLSLEGVGVPRYDDLYTAVATRMKRGPADHEVSAP